MPKKFHEDKNQKKNIIYISLILAIFIAFILIYWILSADTLGLGPDYAIGLPPCIAASGFTCQNLVYNHSTGNIIVTLGQSTGNNWLGANFVFVPQGSAVHNGIPEIAYNSTSANTVFNSTPIVSGNTIIIHLPVSGKVSIGKSATGMIWVEYKIYGGQQPQYVQIATLNIKAS